jgi:uncharacterized protein (TIGR03435 family)
MLLGVGVAWGQVAKAPAFEVASVRLSAPGGDGMTVLGPYGQARFTVKNAPLPFLLQLAFGVESHQVVGLPGWADSTLYDVNAKPEGDKGLSYEELKLPLQQLLVQRLHIKFHRETKLVKGYALVAAKGGPKLTANTGTPRHAYALRNGLDAAKVDMEHFAGLLALATRRPVVDKTGIVGEFDFKLEYAPEGAADSSLPSIYTAVQEQLGLRLEVAMVPVEMLVVDKVDRVPVEN